MTPERWQAIEELFHAALELSGDRRAAFLLNHEPSLRIPVEAMLAQECSAANVLDRPAWEQADATLEVRAMDLAAGTRLGPYRVEATIGAGGWEKSIEPKTPA